MQGEMENEENSKTNSTVNVKLYHVTYNHPLSLLKRGFLNSHQVIYKIKIHGSRTETIDMEMKE